MTEILIDSREQRPLWKGDRITLNVGDYTTAALRGCFVVERKSPADLYGTMLKGHGRFRRQAKRALATGVTMVVLVECSRKVFLNKQYPGASYNKVASETVLKIITTFSKRYGVTFGWCASRAAMKAKIERLFRAEEARISGKRPAKFAPRRALAPGAGKYARKAKLAG